MNDMNILPPHNAALNAGGPAADAAQHSEPTSLLSHYIRILVHRRNAIGAVILGCLLIALLATFLMSPKYTATATIEIAREANKVVQVGGVEQESNSADLEFYQTQYGLLQSRSLAERVARELKLADNAGFFEMFGRPQDQIATAEGRTSIAREARVRIAGEILLKKISIEPVRLSRLVTIRLSSPDPQLSARIVNAWTANFIQSTLERRFEATSYARKFLEQRLDDLRRKLGESERQLVSYADDQQIINLPGGSGQGDQRQAGERSIVAENLAALNSELAEAEGARITAEARWRQSGGANAGAAPESLQNVAIASLREKRAEIAADYQKLLVQFDPAYQPALALKAQLEQLDRSIAREETRVSSSFGSNYRAAVSREQALNSRVGQLKRSLLDTRRRSIQYNIYQRDVDTNRQLYDGLLQRYKEIGVAGGVGVNNVSLVDPAQPPKEPSSPKLVINLALGLLAGLILGAALALALEQVDETVSDPTAVGTELGLPLLGTIPKAKEAVVELLRNPKSDLVEAYLSVQTNLEFATSRGMPRSLAITSTRAAEGKSTTALAIAATLSRSGRRVVLVDGDMRSPSVHHLFGLSNEKGLSNLF